MSPIPKEAARAQDTLEFHPLATAFPLMEGPEFKEFVADIKAHGLREPITMFEGKILEGRNRYRACLRLKIEPRVERFKGDDAAAAAFVASRNVHRRHLTPKQKREAIAKLLKLHPDKSNREIGRLTRTDDKTVASVRAEKEATAEIPQTKKRVGKDGRARPAKRKKRSTTVETAAAATPTTVTPTAVPASTNAPAFTAGTPAAAAEPRPTPNTAVVVDSTATTVVFPPPPPASHASHRSGSPEQVAAQITADRKYARGLVKHNREAAVWLCQLLGSEKRRVAVADALVIALKTTVTASTAKAEAAVGNDADAEKSAEIRKTAFAAMEGETPSSSEKAA